MATRIRLRRMGRKKQPAYRIVVIEKQTAREGPYIESLGHYDPRTNPATIDVKADRVRHWLTEGATPSDTVRSLLKRAGVFTETVPAEAAPSATVPAEAAPSATASAEAAPSATASAEAPSADAGPAEE